MSQPVVKPQPSEAKMIPQPILKKSSAPHGESNKTTRLLLEQPDGGSITHNPSHSPTPSFQEPQSKESAAGRQALKKSHFTAGTRSGRRRPVFSRRKSSQVSTAKSASGPSNEPQPQQKARPPPRPYTDPLGSMESFELVFDEDYVPPAEDTDPTTNSTKTQEDIEVAKIREALADISTIEIPKLSSKTPTATTTAATTPNIVSDQTDTLLSQGLETVSHAPKEQEPQSQTDKEAQSAESQENSRPSSQIEVTPGSTPVPGFPGLRRIPMPEEMKIILLNILNDESPLECQIPLPTRPWWMYEHPWSPVPRKEYLKDWMMLNEEWDKQPSTTPLTQPRFRTHFAELVASTRAEEEAAIAYLNDIHVSASSGRSSSDNDSEQYYSVLSQMVEHESHVNRSAREDDLERERMDEQPHEQEPQQQKPQVVWHDSGGDCITTAPPVATQETMDSSGPSSL